MLEYNLMDLKTDNFTFVNKQVYVKYYIVSEGSNFQNVVIEYHHLQQKDVK